MTHTSDEKEALERLEHAARRCIAWNEKRSDESSSHWISAITGAIGMLDIVRKKEANK